MTGQPNLSPDLLREFEASFEAIAKVLEIAEEKRSFAPAEIAAQLLGLREQIDQRREGFSATYIWERREGNLCLWLRTHWYDQSQPFQILPDLRKLKLELRQGSVILRSAESSYED
jgi:hypothetical protein